MKNVTKIFILTIMTVQVSVTAFGQTVTGTLFKDAGTGDWSIGGTGEYLEIREPEDGNKIWARFIDDQRLELIGTPNLHLNGYIRGGSSGALRINSGNGYVDIGPMNTSWSHFSTDRNRFYFNKEIRVNSGYIGSYDEDLYLKTAGTSRLRIAKSDGDVYLYGGDLKLQNNKSMYIGTPYGKGIRFHYYNNTHAYIDFNENLYFRSGSNGCPLILQNDGNVAIGMNPAYSAGARHNQGYRLAVNGNILCEGIDVIVNVPNSDYVFEDDYKLRTLADVESFIKENKHLPEVSSAEEFKDNGYNIGEMDDILLRKIEELTLYMIDLKKENEKLSNRIDELEK